QDRPPAPDLPGGPAGDARRRSAGGVMSTVWRYTAMLLAGAFLLLGAGLYTACTGLALSRAPSGLGETRALLRQMGGEPGLAARKTALANLAARLRPERE